MVKIGKPIPVILIIILTMLSLHTNLYQINAQIIGSSGKRIIEIHANYAIVRDELYIPEVTVNLTQHIPKQYSNELFMVKAYDEKGG